MDRAHIQKVYRRIRTKTRWLYQAEKVQTRVPKRVVSDFSNEISHRISHRQKDWEQWGCLKENAKKNT